jgi:hypothetical protein
VAELGKSLYVNAENFANAKKLIKILPNLKNIQLRGFPEDALDVMKEILKKYAPKVFPCPRILRLGSVVILMLMYFAMFLVGQFLGYDF